MLLRNVIVGIQYHDIFQTEAKSMNEDTFNIQIRKFLKKVGINSQREIESKVRSGIESSQLKGDETLKAVVTLKIAQADVDLTIEDTISLE
jgi:hypothetical protein